MSVSISEKKIKSKVKSGDRVIVVENITYPSFESDKHKKLCKKMNEFYFAIAKKYSFHIEKRLAERIRRGISKYNLPVTAKMKYLAVLCGGSVLSVVLDLSFVNGGKVRQRRFSQMWSIKKEDILPSCSVLEEDRKSRRELLALVMKKACENAENSAFGYFPDYAARLRRNFRTCNCFLTPGGVCFFADAGILSPEKYGACSLVIPFDEVRGLLKKSFLEEYGEFWGENSDIVNNV